MALPGTTEVAIIGGGVMGCSLAYELAKRGVKSNVLEQVRFATGASGATAGVISPLWHVDPEVKPMFRLGLRSLELFPSLAAELSDAGVDPEFQRTGVLKLAFTEAEVDELRQNLVWQSELGLGVGWLSRDEVLRRELEVNPQVMGGVYSPMEGCVRGQQWVDSLVHAAGRIGYRIGARFHKGVQVTGLTRSGNRVTGVETTEGDISAGQVVLAAGPWSGIHGKWLPTDAGVQIPVRPVKGQRILLHQPGFLPKSPVRNFDAYVVPQRDGNVLVGATREEGRFDERVTAEGISQMVASGTLSFPGLADATFVSGRAGVRPATPDGMPILGPVPGIDGLCIATGHDAVGIMLSPGTAELMVDYIVDGSTGPLEPFSLSRFG